MKEVRGIAPELVWHESGALGRFDAVVLPGGFSFGDYLRAGSIAARSPAISTIRRMAETGNARPRHLQRLPDPGRGRATARGAPPQLRSEVRLQVDQRQGREPATPPSPAPATKGQVLRMPIAHGEGRYYAPEDELRRLEKEHRVIFRYTDANGKAHRTANPTGTTAEHSGNLERGGERRRPDAPPRAGRRPAAQPVPLADGRLVFRRCSEGERDEPRKPAARPHTRRDQTSCGRRSGGSPTRSSGR